MSQAASSERAHSNAYSIFILVLTIQSLFIMAGLLLPVSAATHNTLEVWDTVVCVIFLGDFAFNLAGSRPRREYFINRYGWLDLLGSIPNLGILQFGALIRLARVARLARISRQLGGQQRRELVRDIIRNRGQYALFITMLLVLIVLTTSSVLILQFESSSPDANITTGGNALWWSIVTITTVGYGDYYPVTTLGRITAVVVMFAGIGIIGALASILASLLVSPAPEDKEDLTPEEQSAQTRKAVQQFAGNADDSNVGEMLKVMAETRDELERMRQELALIRAERKSPPAPTETIPEGT